MTIQGRYHGVGTVTYGYYIGHNLHGVLFEIQWACLPFFLSLPKHQTTEMPINLVENIWIRICQYSVNVLWRWHENKNAKKNAIEQCCCCTWLSFEKNTFITFMEFYTRNIDSYKNTNWKISEKMGNVYKKMGEYDENRKSKAPMFLCDGERCIQHEKRCQSALWILILALGDAIWNAMRGKKTNNKSWFFLSPTLELSKTLWFWFSQ